MYRNETLQLNGDSIWGRITFLLSSLLGRPCTGKERAQFYETMLISSLQKNEQEGTPVQYMIDDAVMSLNREGDPQRAKKFTSLIRKLRGATDKSDEIISFLLSLPRTNPEHAGTSKSHIPSYCIKSELLCEGNEIDLMGHQVFLRMPFIDYTNIPLIVQQSRYQYKKDVAALNQLCCSGDETTSCNSESDGSDEDIQHMVVDSRGRVHPRACDPELRSLCKLRVGDDFYIVSWHQYLRCLVHMLMGKESFLFQRESDGCFSLCTINNTFLELEDFGLLPRIALPFLLFANRLCSLEKFVALSSESSTPDSETTKALLILKLCASEQLWKFRNEIGHFDDGKEECSVEDIRRLLRELLDRCDVFSHFIDLVLHVQSAGTQDAKTLIDTFYIAKVMKGQMMPYISELYDNVLVKLLQHYAESVMLYLIKGETDSYDGVFSVEMTNPDRIFGAASEENEAAELKPPMLISENFCKKWLLEGKFRKLILGSPNLKNYDSEEWNSATTKNLMAKLADEEIRKTLRWNKSGVVGSLLDNCFQKIYHSQHTECIRRRIIDDFKQTVKLLRDVYLCDDARITEIVISNEEEDAAQSKQSSLSDELMDYLTSKGYSSTLVQGFLHLTNSFDEQNEEKVRYKPPFPLHIIFTPRVLLNYELIWKLQLRLAVECMALEKLMVEKNCNHSIAMMQMRMWNFIRAVRCFFHDQLTWIVAKEFQEGLDEVKTVEEAFQLHKEFVRKLCRHCLLRSKNAKLWNVLDSCISLVTEYRICRAQSSNTLRLFKIFSDFHYNVDLFCNAVRRTSVGAYYWLSDFLLLADFPGIYTDLYGSTLTLGSVTSNSLE